LRRAARLRPHRRAPACGLRRRARRQRRLRSAPVAGGRLMRAAVNLIALFLAAVLAIAAGLGGTPRDSVSWAQHRQVTDASGEILTGPPARTVASLSILSDRLLIHL